jgi:hypothetical protein
MSAFVVADFHINALVSWAAANKVRYFDGRSWLDVRNDEKNVAQALHAENVRSVNHRYKEFEPASGFATKQVSTSRMTPEMVINAANCLRYQSCETDDYESTLAFKMLNAIREEAIGIVARRCDVYALRGPESFEVKP